MTGHVDASLSLLNRIVAEALDPGYREVAGAGSPRRLDWRHSFTLAVALAVLAFVVVAAVLQVRQGAPSAAQTRAELVERVIAENAALAGIDDQVTRLSDRVAERQMAALGDSAADMALADKAAQLARRTGLAPVSGSGVVVVLDDGHPAPVGEGGPDLARVLDTDVQLTVNGLFAAGATAVAVNGQRITTLTPIRSAGSAILVGFRPLAPPYEVTAVGDGGLAATFVAGAARAELGELEVTYGVRVDVVDADEVTVPGRADQPLRYARGGASS